MCLGPIGLVTLLTAKACGASKVAITGAYLRSDSKNQDIVLLSKSLYSLQSS